MLVYGDVERVQTVRAKQKAIENCLDQVSALPEGSKRHAALVAVFMATSELIQSLIEADFRERGFDALSPVHKDGMACLSVVARSVVESWQSGFSRIVLGEDFRDKLLSFDPDRTISTKQAEGYAFYALYPESYVEAAARSGLGSNTWVIGIRSIGVGLGALVAATLGTTFPTLTLRPVGHPFRREIRIDPAIAALLIQDQEAAFAIVDEGPGLSGSSFGAVSDWLEAAGISRERIHFFPSHAGQLGPHASASHRERWGGVSRHFVGMDELLCDRKQNHLRSWVESITGTLKEELEDISGGAWRMSRYPSHELWPAANLQQEKRKFLARTERADWLVKFAGIGEIGLRKYELAQKLNQAGFTPEVAGYRHGFLVEQWHGDAPSLDQHPIERSRLISRIGAYLGFRGRHLPAEAYQGASTAVLRNMALYNTEQALGEQAAAALGRTLTGNESFSGLVRRVFTDNRMHPWEWLLIGDRLIKTDAIDHCMAHDLVGCQDIVWDIAGAVAEFHLSEQEATHLCSIVQEESGHPVHLDLLSFMLPCYLAFQLGAHAMAANSLQGSKEEARLRLSIKRYGALLRSSIEHPSQIGFTKEQDKVPAS